MATKLLANQLRTILNEPVEGFAVELADEANLFIWRVWIEGPKDTCYDGGIFQLSLNFPKDYPMSPPELKFVSDFWHPNVFATGKVCMSILHPPGEDPMSGELPEERWLPTQSVTTIILSLLSLLNDPNCASPANVDASVQWRNQRDAFKTRCAGLVEKAKRELPPHVVIPHPESDADQHRRRVQKFHEMNNDLGYEDFYEDDAGQGENNNESGDENEFLDSENEDINTDDEQSPKEMPRAAVLASRQHEEEVVSNDSAAKEELKLDASKDEKEKGKGKVKAEEGSSDVGAVVEADITTSVPASSSSSTTTSTPANTSAPSSQLPLTDPPNNSSSSNPNANNNNSNNANTDNNAPTSNKKAKKQKTKKGKKCSLM